MLKRKRSCSSGSREENLVSRDERQAPRIETLSDQRREQVRRAKRISGAWVPALSTLDERASRTLQAAGNRATAVRGTGASSRAAAGAHDRCVAKASVPGKLTRRAGRDGYPPHVPALSNAQQGIGRPHHVLHPLPTSTHRVTGNIEVEGVI